MAKEKQTTQMLKKACEQLQRDQAESITQTMEELMAAKVHSEATAARAAQN